MLSVQTFENTFNLHVKELVRKYMPEAKTYKTEKDGKSNIYYIRNHEKRTIGKVLKVPAVGLKIWVY